MEKLKQCQTQDMITEERDELNLLSPRIKELEREINRYQTENEMLRVKMEQVEGEKEDLDKRAKIIDDMSQMLQSKINTLSQSANELFSDMETNKNSQFIVSELERKINAKNIEIEQLRTKLRKVSIENENMIDRNTNLVTEIEKLQNELYSINKMVTMSKDKELEYEAKIKQLTKVQHVLYKI